MTIWTFCNRREIGYACGKGGKAMIPPFRDDGFLPDGLWPASEAEVTFRFGSANARRRRLILRLRRWIELARQIGALRLFIDGSFVTGKNDPNDVDAVIFLPADFQQQVEQGIGPALQLEVMLLSRRPEEIFAAEDDLDWNEWLDFFQRTRELDGRSKGLVEVQL